MIISREERSDCIRVVTEACREARVEDLLSEDLDSTIHATLVGDF